MKLAIIYIAFSLTIYSQTINLKGTLEPGGIMFAHAPNAVSVYLNEMELLTDIDGKFIFGFDRNDEGNYFLKIKFQSGKSIIKVLKLNERKFKIQKINNSKKQFNEPSHSDSILIEKQRVIKANSNKMVGSITKQLFGSGFIRPVKSKRLTGVFGSQRILNGVPKNVHNGVDYGVPKGTPVYASADGVVRLTADNFYYSGNFVFLDHGQGLTSKYLHLSKILVEEGKLVKKGDIIGLVGTTGRSTGPHLHWMVQWFEKRIDPLNLLKVKYLFE